jgi:transglutaminase-like putative cysteine protease
MPAVHVRSRNQDCKIQAMQYQISHVTRYTYTSPVSVCHNLLTLTPRSCPRVQCITHKLRIKPNPPDVHRRFDAFGNSLAAFSIDESHDELTIAALSRVVVQDVVQPNPEQAPQWQQLSLGLQARSDANWFAASYFLYDSPRVERGEQYALYGRQTFNEKADVLTAALDLCERVYREFKYDTQATHSATSTAHAFSIRRGVCQDFAHVMIACLRSLGVPARYVSGYLRTVPPTGQARLVGADQSHAWVGVYCGERLGWVDVDPTNNCVNGKDHIPIAWGRDYSDVVPVRGAFLGGGDSHISVAVDVIPTA